MMKQEMLTSLHEASHLVAAVLLRPEWRPKLVTIVPNDTSRGRVDFERPAAAALDDDEFCEDACVIAIAGNVASRLLGGVSNTLVGKDERVFATLLMGPLVIAQLDGMAEQSSVDRRRGINRIIRRAVRFVLDHENLIRSLALVLEEARTLEGEALARIIEAMSPAKVRPLALEMVETIRAEAEREVVHSAFATLEDL